MDILAHSQLSVRITKWAGHVSLCTLITFIQSESSLFHCKCLRLSVHPSFIFLHPPLLSHCPVMSHLPLIRPYLTFCIQHFICLIILLLPCPRPPALTSPMACWVSTCGIRPLRCPALLTLPHSHMNLHAHPHKDTVPLLFFYSVTFSASRGPFECGAWP